MRPLYFFLTLLWAPTLFAADEKLTREKVELFVAPRSPEQINAFYGARGMPSAALQELSKACFLTVGLHNRRAETLWLEPAKWRFIDAAGKPIKLISRQEWKARWMALSVPLAAQSTFAWSQLPESRDLYPEESVGGNLSIQPPAGTFSLIANFRTGNSADEKTIAFTIPNLSCSRQGSAP